MLKLIEEYYRLRTYRMAAIILLAAPLPALYTKLQGALLSETNIIAIGITGNLIYMCSSWANKHRPKTIFISYTILSSTSLILVPILALWGTPVVVVWALTLLSLFECFSDDTLRNKLSNEMKDIAGKEFDSSKYGARMTKYLSAVGLGGQAVAGLGFYLTHVDPVMVILAVDLIIGGFMIYFNIQEWRILSNLGIMNKPITVSEQTPEII